MAKVLIACEQSQLVCMAMRNAGHEAWSCDILPSIGGQPQWHITGDVLEQLNKGWDCMVAFPPCTHLATSGARHFEKKKQDGRQGEAIAFFMAMVNAPIPYIAIENPVGIMSTHYKAPTQIIQPYYFGDEAQKTTCLWLKGLPPLYHNEAPNLFDDVVTHVGKGEFVYHSGKKKPKWYADAFNLPPKERARVRSKTFNGIAQAMGEQWGRFLHERIK